MTQCLVDVGGYRLDLRVTGRGTPAVVCLSSAGGAHEQWSKLVPLVSDMTAVATYGRPGLGDSDLLPLEIQGIPRGCAWIAEQLRILLTAAGIKPPYVLVTGSIGAFIGDQYAALWPDEIAGLVLVDPTGLRTFPGLAEVREEFHDSGEPGSLLINRLTSFAEQRARVGENRDGRIVVLSAAVGRWLRNEPADWHRPLTLAEVDAHWVKMQHEWVQRLDAVQIVADRAGHLVHYEQPQLVAAVVRDVVNAARAGTQVEFDADRLAGLGGNLG